MTTPSDPNMIIAGFAVGGLLLAALWRLVVWIREAPVTPDPWDAEVEKVIQDPEAQEICPHCSTPQPSTAWFCQHCGRAVGPYNNLMPYVQVFSEGEVFRNGTSDRLRNSLLIPVGYFLISLGFLPLVLFRQSGSWLFSLLILLGLISFWVSLLKNLKRSKVEPAEGQQENTQ